MASWNLNAYNYLMLIHLLSKRIEWYICIFKQCPRESFSIPEFLCDTLCVPRRTYGMPSTLDQVSIHGPSGLLADCHVLFPTDEGIEVVEPEQQTRILSLSHNCTT